MTQRIALALVAAALGALAALGITSALAPSCPTEDACSIDYHDGRWVVTEDTP
jgi:hypothetical protein